MKIYKLDDEVSESKGENDGAVLKITDLKQGVKNPNRVNVYVNDEYCFSLDVTQVVDYKLKVGREISENELNELKQASEFGKIYQRALEWVLVRPRSEKETREYIARKTKLPISDAIIQRLSEKGYLDDSRFAEWYVENRFVKKGVSRKRLKMELMKKGVLAEIIDEVLNLRNDEEEILKIIARKRSKYDDEKLISYLVSQGFSFQLARELVLSYEKD